MLQHVETKHDNGLTNLDPQSSLVHSLLLVWYLLSIHKEGWMGGVYLSKLMFMLASDEG